MILNYDKKKGNFSSIFDKFIESGKQAIEIPKEIKDAFSLLDGKSDLFKGLNSDAAYKLAKNMGVANKEVVDFVRNGKGGLKEYEAAMQSANNGTSKFAKGLSSLKNIGGALLSTLGNMAISMAVSFAVEKAVEWVYNLAKAEEIAIEKGKEAQQAIATISEGFENQSSFIENDSERFLELREEINIDDNSNISLNNEEYEEYLSLNNQIADLFPTLVSGFDAQGNAILNLSGNSNEASSSLADLLNQERQLADFKISQNLEDAFAGVATANKILQENIENRNIAIENAQKSKAVIDDLNLGNLNLSEMGILSEDGEINGFKAFANANNEEQSQQVREWYTAFAEAASRSGIEVKMSTSMDEMQAGEMGTIYGATFIDATEEQLESFPEVLSQVFEDFDYDYLGDIEELSLANNADMAEIKANWNGLVPSIVKSLSLYDSYDELNDEFKQLINSAVGNLDLNELTEEQLNNATSDPRAFIRKMFLDPISNMDTETEAAFNKIYDVYSDGEKSLAERIETIKTLRSDESVDQSLISSAMRSLGFVDYDEQWGIDQYFPEIGSQIDKILEKAETFSRTDLLSFNDKEFEIAYDLIINEGKSFDTIEELKTAVEDVQETVAAISSEPITFSSILSSEDITKQVDDFQSNISSLDDALETLRNGEEVDLTDLVQEFPELAGQTDNLQEAISNLKVDKLREFSTQWKTAIADLTGEEAVKAQQFLEDIISSMEFSDVDLSTYQSIVRKNLSALGGTGSGSSPMDVWNQLFEKYGNTVEGREALIKLSADPSNVYKAFDELDKMASETSLEIKVGTDAEIMSNNTNLLSQIETAKSALSSYSAGQSISFETFTAEGMEDYQSALEYVNGTMQLNAEMVEEITKAKAEEQIAINDVTKAQKQAEYLKNASQIETLRQKIEDNNFATGESADSIQLQIDSLLESNNAIISQCGQLDILNASLRESIGTYQAWNDAQNGSESGDMFDDTLTALQQIDDVLNNEDSELYGRVGRDDYKTSLDLVIPETVNKEDTDAVNNYLDSIYSMFTHDEDDNRTGLNIENFCQEAVDKGLMVLDESTDSYQVAGKKTMEDFAEGLNLSLPLVQAMFGEMEEFGGQFDWADEAVQNIGDLGVTATEAAESLRGIEGNETLKINLDVSDIETKEGKISALDETIQEMDGYKATLSVDSAEYEQANSIIQYCVAQKQLLNEPAVMSVDTSLVEGKVGEAVSLLQQFQTAQNELEMQSSIGMDTTEAQANVNALAQQIQGLDPNVTAVLGLDTTSIDTITTSVEALTPEMMVKAGINDEAIIGYVPAEKESTVKYNKDSTIPDEYDPEDKNATVVYDVDHYAVDIYDPDNLTRTVTYNVKTNGSVDGQHSVNGTAHANGTVKTGRALASGDWGTKKAGTTLVGELGREIVVDPRTGRWNSVGDNGAEFVDIPKGAIVFNHVQTEELLKNGYVAARGTALANGTANISGTAMVTGGIKASQAKKSTVNDYSSTSSSKSTNSSTKSTKDATKATKDSTKATKDNTDSTKKNTKEKEKEATVFDWVAERLEYFSDKTKAIADTITDYVTSAFKTKQLKNQIGAIDDEVTVNKKAYNRYMQEADSVGLSSSWKKKVQKGDYSIKSIKDEKLVDKINKYQEYYDKAQDCKTAVTELKNEQLELFEDLMNMPTETAEKKIEKLERKLENLNSAYSTMSGGSASSLYAEQIEKDNSKLAYPTKNLSAAQTNALKYGNDVTYKGQNALLNAQLSTVKDENKERQNALSKANKNLATQQSKAEKAEKKKNKANTVVADARSGLLGNKTVTKKLSKSQLKSLKDGEEVSTKGITNKKVLNQIKEYNALVEKADTATENATTSQQKLTIAQNKQSEAYSNAIASQAEVAQMTVGNEQEKFNNIKDYYQATQDYQATLTEDYSTNRELKKAKGKELNKEDFQPEINSLKDQRKTVVAEQKALTKQLNESVSKGIIKEGSEEWYNMKAEIQAVGTEVDNLDMSVLQLQEDIKNNEVEKFNNIKDRYQATLGYQEALSEDYSTNRDLKKAKGKELNKEDFQPEIDSLKDQRKTLVAEQKALIKQLDKSVSEGIIKKNSEEWLSMKTDIESIGTAIDNLDMDVLQLQEDIIANEVEKFNNIAGKYDNMLNQIEHNANMINEYMDQAEAKGYVQSKDYYNSLIKNEKKQISNMETERKKLIASLQKSMSEGIIKQGSDEWYEMQAQIDAVSESILEANGNLIDFQNSLREIEWDKFDRGLDTISRVVDESEFLKDIMSDEDMYDDNGKLTDEGMATLGLYGLNYNTYLKQADKYEAEILKLNKEIADDPSNTTLLDRREELLNKQRDNILAAEDEKEAINDLVSDGIDNELDALKELIDKYKDALSSKKDLYDYQNDISDQTSEISSLQKQIAAYSNDTSEEGRVRLQEAQNALKDAQKNLEQTEYDKYISDQEELLDNLYDEYEKILTARADNTDEILRDVLHSVNENSDGIKNTLEEQAKAVGISLTTEMDKIWSADGSVTKILSTYNENFKNNSTTLQATLNDILKGVEKLYTDANKNAKLNINDVSDTSTTGANPQVKGYASGIDYVKDDEWAWTQEEGTEIITRPDGSILTPLKKGSGVINNPTTEKLLSLANDPQKFLMQNTPVPVPIVNKNMGASNVTNEITFNLPDMNKPEDFMNWMVHNKKAQQAIQDMTIGRTNGKSSLYATRNKF